MLLDYYFVGCHLVTIVYRGKQFIEEIEIAPVLLGIKRQLCTLVVEHCALPGLGGLFTPFLFSLHESKRACRLLRKSTDVPGILRRRTELQPVNACRLQILPNVPATPRDSELGEKSRREGPWPLVGRLVA